MFALSIVCAVIGIVLLIILAVFKKTLEDEANIVTWPGLAVIGIGVVFFLFSFLTTIGAGEVGIPVLFGDVLGTTLDSGLHTRVPWLAVPSLPTRIQEYTMSIASGEGAKSANDAVDILTSNGVKVIVDGTVKYRIDEEMAPWVYENVGKNIQDIINIVVRPASRGLLRDMGEDYTSTALYQHRTNYRDKVKTALEKNFAENGIILVDFILRNVILPAEIVVAVNAVVVAEQKIAEKENLIAAEYKENERKVAEAAGIAEANSIINESLTQSYLQWYYIQKLETFAQSDNNTIIVMPFDQTLIPMINVNK